MNRGFGGITLLKAFILHFYEHFINKIKLQSLKNNTGNLTAKTEKIRQLFDKKCTEFST